MEFKCLNCGLCCREYICYVNLNDIMRWLEQDRLDIISCLTWHLIRERNPPYMLFIPKKKHIKNHSLLKMFYRKEWENNNECIFLHDNVCRIYKTRPETCKNFPKGKLDSKCPGLKRETITREDRLLEKELSRQRKKQNIKIYKEREMLSKVIKLAKEQTSIGDLAKLLMSKRKTR